MPIPTRSASLREPRNPASNIARPTTTTAIPTTGTAKGPTRLTTDKTRPSAISSPAEGGPTTDNGVALRGRTLLPQRSSNPNRDDSHGLGQVRFLPPQHRAPRGETSPKRQSPTRREPEKQESEAPPTSAAAPARRQSLLRPGALRTTSLKANVSAPIKGAVPAVTPPSPHRDAAAATPNSIRIVATASESDFCTSGCGPGTCQAPQSDGSHEWETKSSRSVPDASEAPNAILYLPAAVLTQEIYQTSRIYPRDGPGAVPGSGGLLIPSSWPDIAALQTELLQLSLFHSNSLERHAEWQSESESHLRKHYDAVADQYRALQANEKTRQRQLNTQALACWAQKCRDHQGPIAFPEQIQILSQVLQEISDLATSRTSGRYISVVDMFEKWFQQAESIQHTRESSSLFDRVVFIDPLDRQWKDEAQALHAKLELCARQLQSLDILGFGDVERLEQSALIRIVRGLDESIQLMMQELRAMRTLEAEVVRSEREAVSQIATHQTGQRREFRTARVGIWKS
ncbi:hypothetical protein N7462_002968 [Penicillium macrosclerotiorum]|uniref:uncharacterized protein n=1 Tax=Penicillium macrosclerotiorum TaxID=303699 RepID=UPI0025473E4A|nr:uncharacterized protein N7462_002968 [Penicillium macrosclerotiorum]KAJ5688576.1 hypothetical protein N7462_002968 [Penicillium macrosclerotiorum]